MQLKSFFAASLTTAVALSAQFGVSSADAVAAPIIAKGAHGEILSAIPTKVAAGGMIKVSGAHFDETVGIYLAYCVLPKKGKAPTPCGGGVNKAGIGSSSYWISSNPPPYGVGLAEGYSPGGRFTKNLHVSLTIGKYDCRVVKCAVTVRADHTREGDRNYDLFIPITFQSATHIQRTAK